MMWKKEKRGGEGKEARVRKKGKKVREAVGVAGKKCVMRGKVMEKVRGESVWRLEK